MSPIKEAIETKGMSQRDVARKLNVTDATICEWISGRKKPTVRHLLDLAELLGVSTDFLLGRSVDKKAG